MKKILSLVLALVLAFSLCTMAFAVDTDAIAKQVSDYISAALKKAGVTMPAELSAEALQKAVTDALKDAGAFDLSDMDTSKIPTMVNDAINKVAAQTGIPVNEIKNMLSESGLAKMIAGTYGIGDEATTKAPVTTTTTAKPIPATGSAVGGIAIFATLSIAAAAAFVCIKKK